ncbi:hypothetical protein, partial [Phaffia rhodozyma]
MRDKHVELTSLPLRSSEPNSEKRIILLGTLQTGNTQTSVRVLLDSGSQLNIINHKLASSLPAKIDILSSPRLATTVDGTPLTTGPIDSVLFGQLGLGGFEETVPLHLAATASVDIIL